MIFSQRSRLLRMGLGAAYRLIVVFGMAAMLASCRNDVSSSYALNVYVTGLSGSGLQVTLNSGPPINISTNSQTTLARLTNGATYAVAITTQPSNPAQTCSPANSSGKISGNNVDVMISCVSAVQTSTVVSLDPALPTAIGTQISTIASPLMSGSLNSPLSVPAASPTSESMVLALDAGGNILLASLVTQYQTSLSTDSTALTLTRIAIGPIDSTASVDVLNASIRATPEYPHLVALIQAALEAQSTLTGSDAVIESTSLVVAQLFASAMSISSSVHATLLRGIKALNPTIVQTTPATLLSWSGANTAFQSVQLQGVTATAATLSNGTSIAWSVFASDPQSGQPFCDTDGCETVLMPPKLLQQADFILGTPITYPTKDVPATNTAYNLTLQQSKLSTYANLTQSEEDLAFYELSLYYGGEAPALTGCITEIVTTAVSPEAVVAGLGNRSGTAIESYINSTLKDSVFNTGGLKAVGSCLGLAPPNVNDGFLTALTSFVFKFGASVASVLAKPAIASAGLGFELGQTLYYQGPNFTPVNVGICVGTPPNSAFGIVDCAKSFVFNPTSLYMAPTATGSAPAITAIGTVTPTTLVPTDLMFTIEPALVSIDPTTNNITATGSPSSTPAIVTATSPSTSATGSYQVFVVDPILTPSALAVDTTSSAQTVTVTLLGPNENPIVLPTGITWTAQLVNDSDSSSIPITPTTTGSGSATWTIPAQTPSGRLDVTSYDSDGISYGFESITVTNIGTPSLILNISPPTPSVAVGSNVTLTVSATNASGAPIAVPSNLSWDSSDTTVAIVLPQAVTGLVNGAVVVYGFSAGSAIITATDPVSMAQQSVTLTVVNLTSSHNIVANAQCTAGCITWTVDGHSFQAPLCDTANSAPWSTCTLTEVFGTAFYDSVQQQSVTAIQLYMADSDVSTSPLEIWLDSGTCGGDSPSVTIPLTVASWQSGDLGIITVMPSQLSSAAAPFPLLIADTRSYDQEEQKNSAGNLTVYLSTAQDPNNPLNLAISYIGNFDFWVEDASQTLGAHHVIGQFKFFIGDCSIPQSRGLTVKRARRLSFP